ncbi:MAG: PKD domain-containing protein [Gemmataceae bacterium]|nr:PKD domain-containing protein [Gemmataceae bacterium]
MRSGLWSWAAHTFSTATRGRKRRPSFRLDLERLEDRTVPAVGVGGIGGAAAVNEGTQYTLSLGDDGTQTGWAINWGDGSALQTVPGGTLSVTHTYADGLNNFTISAAYSDSTELHAALNTQPITVSNVAPTLSITKNSASAQVVEGMPFTFRLNRTDPGADAISRWNINWGDGNTETITGSPSTFKHAFLDGPKSYTITATATDEDGTFDATPLTIDVVNAAPLVDLGLDPTFGTNGLAITGIPSSSFVNRQVLQVGDQIVAVSWQGTWANLVRFNQDGSLDAGFGPDGSQGIVSTPVPGLTGFNPSPFSAVVAGDYIYVGGYDSTSQKMRIIRYSLDDGILDTSFNGGQAYVTAPAVGNMSGGMAVFGDYIYLGGAVGQNPPAVSRFRFAGPEGGVPAGEPAVGQFDSGFGSGGVATFPIPPGSKFAPSSFAIQADGKLVLAGSYTPPSTGTSANQFAIIRFKPDGTPDPDFNPSGAIPGFVSVPNFGLGSNTQRMFIEPDDGSDYANSIVLGGYFFTASGSDHALVRVADDGSIMQTKVLDLLGSSGSDFANAMIRQFDGKIVLGFSSGILRLNQDFSPDATLGTNGDGKVMTYFPLQTTNPMLTTEKINIIGLVQAANDGDIVALGTVGGGSGGTGPVNYLGLVRYDSVYPTIAEGGTFTGKGVFVDFGINDGSWKASVDYGDGTTETLTIDTGNSFNLSHKYKDDGVYTITVTVTDKDLATSTPVTQKVTVTKVDPTLGISGAATVNEGAAYVLNLGKSDPGVDTITGWTINWGDGSAVQTVTGNPSSVVHAYADGSAAGTQRTITATATDEDGGPYNANSIIVTVQNVAPQPYVNLDPDFGSNGQVMTDVSTLIGGTNKANQPQTMVVQSDGKFIAIGSASDATKSWTALVRYTATGQVDGSFGTGGYVQVAAVPGATSYGAPVIKLDANGNILIAGSANFAATGNDFFMERYTQAGVLDTTFGNNGIVTTDIGSTLTGDAARFSADSVFGGLVVQPDGKVLVVGTSTPNGGTAQFALARYNANGTLDNTFGVNGVVSQGVAGKTGGALAAGLQSDGKIIATSALGGFSAVRFNANGSLDATFGTGGVVTINAAASTNLSTSFGVGIAADDSIYMTGSASHSTDTNNSNNDIVLIKLTKDGALDTTFAAASPWGAGKLLVDVSGNQDAAYNVAVQPDGKIVIGGYGKWPNTTGLNMVVVRVNPNGTLDSTFGAGGIVVMDYQGLDDGSNGSLGLTPDGDIIVGGYVTVSNTGVAGTHRVWGFTRLLASATPPTFAEGDTYTGTGTFVDPGADAAWSATVDYGDGSGVQALALSGSHFNLSHKYTDDGTYTVSVIVTDKDGASSTVRTQQVVVAKVVPPPPEDPTATFTNSGPVAEDAAATVAFTDTVGTGLTFSYDFNNDGDFTDPGDVANSSSPTASVPASYLAMPGTYTIHGQVADGDGDSVDYTTTLVVNPVEKIAVFRNGTWFLNTVQGDYNAATTEQVSFGAAGDMPVTGDWDGDGVNEIGVFRNGTWFLSTNNQDYTAANTIQISFGQKGDIPVVGKWLGGTVDYVGVFRPSTGQWFLNFNNQTYSGAAGTFSTFNWGKSGDQAVVGDWNGDGTTDTGTFRTGTWYLNQGNVGWNGSPTIAPFQFGAAGDTAVIGKWEGGAIDRVGVFRAKEGNWYLSKNNAAYAGSNAFELAFGSVGDTPLVGQWLGDGIDYIGAFRAKAGQAFLDKGQVDYAFGTAFNLAFGKDGDKAVVAPWQEAV